jgi:hypothetical protein
MEVSDMFKPLAAFSLITAVGLLPATALADVAFDNGAYSGPQRGIFNAGQFTVFEDFTLTGRTTVTGLRWSQHDTSDAVYASTDLMVYSVLPAAGSTALFSSTLTASRSANTNPLPSTLQGFDYAITGLSLTLEPGTYYFGLHNNGSGGLFTWDQTTGNSQTIAGRWTYSSATTTLVQTDGDNSVFQILGTVAAVPEMPTGLLAGAGLAALAGLTRQKRRGAIRAG